MMSDLHATHSVGCEAGQAAEHLESWFADHGDGEDAESAVLALRAPVAFAGLPTLTPARDCVVRLRRLHNAGAQGVRYGVCWQAAGGGPFPRFSGQLTVAGGEARTAVLALDGAYQSPLGTAGRAFDRVLGRAIAESCARELLARIGSYVEQSRRAAATAQANRHRRVESG